MSKKMRWIIISISLVLLISLFIVFYLYFLSRMPNQIHLKADSVQEINFSVPVKGKIVPEVVEAMAVPDKKTKEVAVDFSKPFQVTTGASENYLAKLKLFGFLPYKNVEISVSEEKMLIPCGCTIGIYMQTKGILVIDTGHFTDVNGEEVAPAEHVLQAGDYIVAVNNEAVTKKQDFMDLVANSEGAPLSLQVERSGVITCEELVPTADEAGCYKVGIWIRDSTQGIGTITYMDDFQNFGALGHGVTDSDTGELMEMGDGNLYSTEIVNIKKGERGNPGEITGMIHYVSDNIMGSINENDNSGIYGHLDKQDFMFDDDGFDVPLPLGYKGEVHLGDAQIISDVDGKRKYYEIEITGINPASTDHRGLNIKVKDQKLLDLTGGIIQGMSGSPIIQDGKIVGAVTHVLVSDPQKGYGIFIEDMIGMKNNY